MQTARRSPHGGLANFGYPLTEEFSEKNADTGQTYTVQYFERNRFEWHPEINGGTVLLGRLGAQFYEQTKANVDAAAVVNTPSYDDQSAVMYQFGPGVTAEQQKAATEGIELMRAYCSATFGMQVRNTITVILETGDFPPNSFSNRTNNHHAYDAPKL